MKEKKKLKSLRSNYLTYLKQNPSSFRFLKESCDLLGIQKGDLLGADGKPL